jgi:hypothetical protein
MVYLPCSSQSATAARDGCPVEKTSSVLAFGLEKETLLLPACRQQLEHIWGPTPGGSRFVSSFAPPTENIDISFLTFPSHSGQRTGVSHRATILSK